MKDTPIAHQLQESIDKLRAALATLQQPPPWRWRVRQRRFRSPLYDFYLYSEKKHDLIMDFVRMGMQGAQPRFQFHDRGIMMPLEYWVGGDGVFHNADAEFLETAVNAMPTLLQLLQDAQEEIARLHQRIDNS